MNPQTPEPLQQIPQPGQPAVVSVSVPGPAAPIADQPPAAPAVDPSAVKSAPATADDLDIIEPEWIGKAQHVIAQTAGDPYVLANELNALKADYLKKRYGKEVKAGD